MAAMGVCDFIALPLDIWGLVAADQSSSSPPYHLTDSVRSMGWL